MLSKKNSNFHLVRMNSPASSVLYFISVAVVSSMIFLPAVWGENVIESQGHPATGSETTQSEMKPLEETEAQYTDYHREAGKLWRHYREKKISRDDYIDRMRSLNVARQEFEVESSGTGNMVKHSEIQERYREIYRKIGEGQLKRDQDPQFKAKAAGIEGDLGS